ncbi:MAG: hypothetical protein R3265_12860 [Hyphomonas sp.]|nr:hypothetical protein [Hyphomonas sp.]
MARDRIFEYDQTGLRRRVRVEVLPDRVRIGVKARAPRELAWDDLTSVRLFAVPSRGCMNRGMALQAGGRKLLFERRDIETISPDSQAFFAAADAVLHALQQARPDLKVRMGVSRATNLAIFSILSVPAAAICLVALLLVPEIGEGGLVPCLGSALLGGCLGVAAWSYVPWRRAQYLSIADLRERLARNCIFPMPA